MKNDITQEEFKSVADDFFLKYDYVKQNMEGDTEDIIFMLKMFHQQYISYFSIREHLNLHGVMLSVLSLILWDQKN